MNWKRIMQAAVCLLVVCCLLFNMSPIRADAVAVSASLVTLGAIATLIAGAAGIVFVTDTQEQMAAIGNSFQTFMYQWGTSAEKLDEVENFLTLYRGIDSGLGGDDDDDSESPRDTKVKLARGILAGISAWCASILMGNIQVEEEVETAPEGYMYYGDRLYPVLPQYDTNAYPYAFICFSGGTYANLWLFPVMPTIERVDTSNFDITNCSEPCLHYRFDRYNGTEWVFYETKGFYSSTMYSIHWNNFDFYFVFTFGNVRKCIFPSSS